MEYIDKLTDRQKEHLGDAFYLADDKTPHNKYYKPMGRESGKQLVSFKPDTKVRLGGFSDANRIYLVHFFKKDKQEWPDKELKNLKKKVRDYENCKRKGVQHVHKSN